jgi:hypothetical protein
LLLDEKAMLAEVNPRVVLFEGCAGAEAAVHLHPKKVKLSAKLGAVRCLSQEPSP